MVVTLLCTGLMIQTAGQGVCVPPTLKIGAISGRVIRTYSKGEESLDGVTISVRKWNSQGSTVAKVITDADGRFTIRTLKPGKYAVVVEKSLYITFVFPVQVTKSSKRAAQRAEVVINLGADYTASCGGSYAERRERRLLSTPVHFRTREKNRRVNRLRAENCPVGKDLKKSYDL